MNKMFKGVALIACLLSSMTIYANSNSNSNKNVNKIKIDQSPSSCTSCTPCTPCTSSCAINDCTTYKLLLKNLLSQLDQAGMKDYQIQSIMTIMNQASSCPS